MNKVVASFFGIALGMSATFALAAGEIKFQKVHSIVSSKYGQSQQSIRIEANVANLAYAKQVYAHIRDNNGVWSDVALSYQRPAESGREIWLASYSLPVNTTYDLQFALKYVVNGQTYWDNNNGQNFSIAKDTGTILASGLNVNDTFYSPTANLQNSYPVFGGKITVRNIAPSKIVRVKYTTDTNPSELTANAVYDSNPYSGAYSSAINPNAYGFEDWAYSFNVGNATKVRYKIEYVVNGQTYTDDNYGQYYNVSFNRQ